MASLTRKKIKGRVYWYLRECRRVDGKPRIVRQKYLGTAEDVERAFRARKTVFGQERTVLVAHNEALLAGQLRGLAQHLSKARRRLRSLQARLRRRTDAPVRRGRTPTRASIQKQVRRILSAQFLSELVRVEVEERDARSSNTSWRT